MRTGACVSGSTRTNSTPTPCCNQQNTQLFTSTLERASTDVNLSSRLFLLPGSFPFVYLSHCISLCTTQCITANRSVSPLKKKQLGVSSKQLSSIPYSYDFCVEPLGSTFAEFRQINFGINPKTDINVLKGRKLSGDNYLT